MRQKVKGGSWVSGGADSDPELEQVKSTNITTTTGSGFPFQHSERGAR